MRILHYYLGPHRRGGLNRYATDLALAQQEAGHDVACLCPAGRIRQPRSPFIKTGKTYRGISVFELYGGIPIPLLEGVADPGMILESDRKLSADAVRDFCEVCKPDLLHIHTWMGFPVELLDELRRRQVKIVYTTHDYFGICPRVNLINRSGTLCDGPDNAACTSCNLNAPSELYLRWRNIPWLMKFKKILAPLIAVRAGFRHKKSVQEPRIEVNPKNYSALGSYYRGLFMRCDKIHFNSRISEKVFQRFFPEITGVVLPISHRGIRDRRKLRQVNAAEIRLCMIGGEASYKGLPLLLKILGELENEKVCNWRLDVWGGSYGKREGRIYYRGCFPAGDEAAILEKTDLLIVPSVWCETFGFIVPEALSMGIPVLCSDTVGAQILVDPGMICHGPAGLKNKLRGILTDPGLLDDENRRICETGEILTMKEHVRAMERFYWEQ